MRRPSAASTLDATAVHAEWLAPGWPAPPGVHAICTTRAGGVSEGAYRSFNLGDHVGDAPADVAANRTLLREAIGVRPVFLRQVHGTRLLALDERTRDGETADACTASAAGIACIVMVADCLPVLFTDACGRRVAAAHAGWRGLAAGVLEAAVGGFASEAAPQELMAWLGPCIGPEAFEVGDEVRAAFQHEAPQASQCFKPGPAPGKWLADLAGLARQRLRAVGVEHLHGNDGSAAWCTVNNPLRFFSHRRDRVSGRFAACIWRGHGGC